MASDETTAGSSGVNLPTGMREAQLHAPARRLADAVNRRNLEQGGREIAFGRYRLLRTLGHGGMGVVFEAHDSVLGRRVALKLLSLPAERAAKMALKEARSLGRLAHANVVHVYDVGEIDGTFYIAMEYVDGQNLRQWLAAARPEPGEIVEVYLAAGRGLAAAHAAGIVHCDFKPANVLLANDGRILVVDFGIAAWLDDERSDETLDDVDGSAFFSVVDGATLATRRIYGTRGYIPPERLERGLVDPRGDQYSFCVAISESLRGSTSSRLDAVLARGLEREPDERFSSMDELLARVREAHEATGSSGRHPSSERALEVVASLAVVAVAVGVAIVPPPPRQLDDAGDPGVAAAVFDYSEQERECRLLDQMIADLRAEPTTPADFTYELMSLLSYAQPRDCYEEFLCTRVTTLYWLAQAELWSRLARMPERPIDEADNHAELTALQWLHAITVRLCRTPDDDLLSDCLVVQGVQYEDALCAAGYLPDEDCHVRSAYSQGRYIWQHRYDEHDFDFSISPVRYAPRMTSMDPGVDHERCAEALARFHLATDTTPL